MDFSVESVLLLVRNGPFDLECMSYLPGRLNAESIALGRLVAPTITSLPLDSIPSISVNS